MFLCVLSDCLLYESTHGCAKLCLAMALTWKSGTGPTARSVSLCREPFRGETAQEQSVQQLLQPSQLHQCALCTPSGCTCSFAPLKHADKFGSLTDSLKVCNSGCLFAQHSVGFGSRGETCEESVRRRQHQAAWAHQPRPYQARQHPLRPHCLPSRHLSRCPAARLSRLSLQQGRRPGLRPPPAPGQGVPLQSRRPQQARQPPLLRRLFPLGTLRHAFSAYIHMENLRTQWPDPPIDCCATRQRLNRTHSPAGSRVCNSTGQHT